MSSSSEQLERISHDLDHIAGVFGGLDGELGQQQATEASGLSRETVERVFCAGVRLLASHAAEASDRSLLKGLSPTEACTAAAALLRAQGLTPFEFGVWFSVSGPRDTAQ